MKKAIMRKYSLLGLVLVIASVITAAILPKNEKRKFTAGKLVATNSPTKIGQLTCKIGGSVDCIRTIDSATTVSGNTSITIGGLSTETTRDAVNPTAQTSLSPH